MRQCIRALVVLLVLGVAGVGAAQELNPASFRLVTAAPELDRTSLDVLAQAAQVGVRAGTAAPYVGGRGLITDELLTGMFINPTSGTLRQYQLDAEYCVLIFHNNGDTVVGHGAIVNFGVTDWLEVGVSGLFVDLPGSADNLQVGGPSLKVRVLKDEGWYPEIAVGGLLLFGDEAIEKNTAYVALSKGLPLSDTGFLRSIRGHAGFRQAWVDVGEDGSFGFFGLELELPQHVFLVAEVSNEDGDATKVPWAAGVQIRHPSGFGFTVAFVQTGTLGPLATYVGVGINF